MKLRNRVLAVLLLALLMINMLPVREVEAATTTDGVYYPDLLTEVELGAYEFQVLEILEKSPYIAVYQCKNDETFYICFFTGATELTFFPVYSGDFWASMRCQYVVSVLDGVIIQIQQSDYLGLRVSMPGYDDFKFIGTNFPVGYRESEKDNSVYTSFVDSIQPYTNNLVHPNDHVEPEPEPLILPVTEPGYEYWLYHKTTSGEYMYWSKDPFDLEVSEGKYLLSLSTGDIVYRLHLSPSHVYYRQILSGSMQYVISPGDVFRSGQELVFDDITIDAWTEGDVTSEEEQEPQYNIPYIIKFLSRIRSARSYADMPREYSMSIDIALSGEFDAAVTEQKVLIDGNYILPSEEYFRYCDSESIDPSTTHFMKFVKKEQKEYYILVDWSHIESIVNLAGLTSDYGFRLTYSNAIDALIARGEFDKLYSKSVQAAYDGDIRKLCCPYRLACTLIGVVDEEYYYGDTYITVLYSEVDDTIEDVFGVYSDYVSLDNDQRTDAIESTINGAQDDKLKDYIDKKDAELDALIEEYEMKLATLDTSLASGGSGDLFGTFSSLANGISGMSGSFRNIATAIGNVFAFFPEEITSLLYAGFIALIVIAVYKALRG